MATPLSPLTDIRVRPDAPLPSGDVPWAVYAEGVRLIALNALGDAALAQDVSQESITRAISALATPRIDAIADVGAFVYGIARHLIADAHRAKGRAVPLDSVDEPAASHPDALATIVHDEEKSRVRSALAQLSESDRTILHLAYFEGLQPDEIAQRLREAAVNIRKRKSRALERLRRAFLDDDTVSR